VDEKVVKKSLVLAWTVREIFLLSLLLHIETIFSMPENWSPARPTKRE
jgi:hypothetical protein